MTKPAILALADGSIFYGQSIGVDGITTGEAVFNTAMSGYQECLSDPASAGQLIAFTYPHIGNSGINPDDSQSDQIQAAGMIIRDLPLLASNFRMSQSLPQYLQEQQKVAIAGVDTRRLTRILRDQGSMAACIMAGADCNAETALQKARQAATQTDTCQSAQVSCTDSYQWQQGVWQLADNSCAQADLPDSAAHVVVYDFGVRRSLLRDLVSLGLRVTVVPASTTVAEAMALQPAGIVLSDGPGNPATCEQAVNTVKQLLSSGLPVFANGLGMQLLALACGATTSKCKTAQLGANHAVKNLASGQVMITRQNYSYMVDAASLPAGLRMTHQSLFDQSVQALELEDKPVFGFQGIARISAEPNSCNEFYARFSAALKA